MKTFMNGLSIILPTAVMLYIILWIFQTTEAVFQTVLLLFLPQDVYFYGLGIVSGLIFVYFVGLLLKVWIFRKVKSSIEALIEKTPFFNAVYGSMKDFFNFTSNMKKNGDKRVVLVKIPTLDAQIMGFITRDDFKGFDALDLEDEVLVFFQMSYQMGGYSLFISKENITPIDMSLEDALRFTATAGISSNNKKK